MKATQGSPIAQLLFSAVDGIQSLVITRDQITITREPSQPWEAIIDEVRDALRDWVPVSSKRIRRVCCIRLRRRAALEALTAANLLEHIVNLALVAGFQHREHLPRR